MTEKKKLTEYAGFFGKLTKLVAEKKAMMQAETHGNVKIYSFIVPAGQYWGVWTFTVNRGVSYHVKWLPMDWEPATTKRRSQDENGRTVFEVVPTKLPTSLAKFFHLTKFSALGSNNKWAQNVRAQIASWNKMMVSMGIDQIPVEARLAYSWGGPEAVDWVLEKPWRVDDLKKLLRFAVKMKKGLRWREGAIKRFMRMGLNEFLKISMPHWRPEIRKLAWDPSIHVTDLKDWRLMASFDACPPSCIKNIEGWYQALVAAAKSAPMDHEKAKAKTKMIAAMMTKYGVGVLAAHHSYRIAIAGLLSNNTGRGRDPETGEYVEAPATGWIHIPEHLLNRGSESHPTTVWRKWHDEITQLQTLQQKRRFPPDTRTQRRLQAQFAHWQNLNVVELEGTRLLRTQEEFDEESRSVHHCVSSHPMWMSSNDRTWYPMYWSLQVGEERATIQCTPDGKIGQFMGKYNDTSLSNEMIALAKELWTSNDWDPEQCMPGHRTVQYEVEEGRFEGMVY